ncbi:hypothetical protein QBC44DRAFT_377808 [Cladorrhinum sp. PSN332]|nr:hypothetical protein QBC44DRAFT_377808 [Cladorrhinum sp. PSN332]
MNNAGPGNGHPRGSWRTQQPTIGISGRAPSVFAVSRANIPGMRNQKHGRYTFFPMPINKNGAELEDKRTELSTLQSSTGTPAELEAKIAGVKKDIELLRNQITEDFRNAVFRDTSGLSNDEKRRAKTALWSRVLMAVGGGLALIAPMLIMILVRSETIALVTTCCFVVAVAVLLAVFMKESQPKDIVGCTMA